MDAVGKAEPRPEVNKQDVCEQRANPPLPKNELIPYGVRNCENQGDVTTIKKARQTSLKHGFDKIRDKTGGCDAPFLFTAAQVGW
jgi:hypothetical protein